MPEWPDEVPVLAADDMMMNSTLHIGCGQHVLIGHGATGSKRWWDWVCCVFVPGLREQVIAATAKAHRRLRYPLSGTVYKSMTFDRSPEEAALLWNESLRVLGYEL